MKKYTKESATPKLKKLKGWKFINDGIEKDFKFQNFKKALSFIMNVGNAAENNNHHPELFNVYNKVHLRLSTHSEGGLTEKDFELAKEIERVRDNEILIFIEF